MEFVVDNQDKYTLLKVEAEKLTSKQAPDVKAQFVLLNSEAVRNIILDLSSVQYCDSSGLSAILVGSRFCESANRSFVIAGITDLVNKIITISQLDKVLHFTPTINEAIDLVFMEEIERDLNIE
jgi:anti-sigma B factor antagonist